MSIWESMGFGAKALGLRLAAAQPLDRILDVQRSRLVKLVQHSRKHSAYYRQKFAGIDLSSFALTDLPTTSKPEIMENFDDALTVSDVHRDDVEDFLSDESNLGKYFQGKYVLSRTSGSQGQPLFVVQPADNLELLFALQASRGNHRSLNVWQAVKHFLSPARLVAVTLKRGFYPSGCAFEYVPPGARQYIKVLQLSLTDRDLIERINEFRPTHLSAYASVLHELARQTEAGRLTLKPELEQVVNISERLMPQARERYTEVFGVPVLNDYAMGECLFLTNGCPASGGMHVNADWAMVEIVDEQNQPVPAGTKGAKVLVTNLANHVQPIIRYEIGDIAAWATEPCACGSHLPLIGGIEGRDSEMFWIEGHEEVQPLPPAVFEEALRQVSQIREYQLIQEDSRRFRILVEALPGGIVDREQATQLLHHKLDGYDLGQQLQIELEAVEHLGPENGDKFKRVVSKVPRPDALART